MPRAAKQLRRDAYVLVDGSYMVYHRYFATKRYFILSRKLGKADADAAATTANADFAAEYERLFERDLCAAAAAASVPLENVVFVRDCARADNWRVAEFPQYKANRDGGKRFDEDVWRLTFEEIVPRLQRTRGLKALVHPNVEADDVIGVVKEEIRRREPEAQVTVVTNDNDYLPLWDARTRIVNLQGHDLVGRALCCNDVTLEELPAFVLTKKVLGGDASDNIPALVKGERDSFFRALALDPEALLREIEERGIEGGYERNRLLIDVARLPQRYKAEVLESWRSLCFAASGDVGDGDVSKQPVPLG